MVRVILTEKKESWSSAWPLHFLGITNPHKHERKNIKTISQTTELYNLILCTTFPPHCHPTIPFAPVCFNCGEKRRDCGNLSTLVVTGQNWVSLSQAVSSCLHTDERRGGWCHLDSLRNKPPKRVITRRHSLGPPSTRTWCGDLIVQWSTGFFFSLDYSLENESFYFFFFLSVSFFPFQSSLEKVIIICGDCVPSLPCGKDRDRWSALITWGSSLNLLSI